MRIIRSKWVALYHQSLLEELAIDICVRVRALRSIDTALYRCCRSTSIRISEVSVLD